MSTNSFPNSLPDHASVFAIPSDRVVQPDQAVMLTNITWAEYTRLREKNGHRGMRMTFDEGALEIMTLGSVHELIAMLIDHFILEWRVARNIPVRPAGSMTLRQKSLDRGLEGDQSYYILHEPDVRSLTQIDLETAPPPDLVIEVEHSAAAIRKTPLYAALKVSEVWRWRKESLVIYRLINNEYAEQAESVSLPGFPIEELRQALLRRNTIDETTLVREFRQRLQT